MHWVSTSSAKSIIFFSSSELSQERVVWVSYGIEIPWWQYKRNLNTGLTPRQPSTYSIVPETMERWDYPEPLALSVVLLPLIAQF